MTPPAPRRANRPDGRPQPGLGEVRLHRESLGSQIAEHLRNEILFGRVAPDTPISQQQLSETFGTSRIPVRDALQRLAHEGFVVNRQGTLVVSRLTPQDITDSFDTLAFIHGRATRRATLNATPEALAALASILGQMHEATKGNDNSLLVALNWEFHRQINILAQSPKLLAMIRSVALELPRSFTEFPAMPSDVIRAKTEILDAMERPDPDVAERLTRSHVERLGQGLVDFFAQKNLVDPGQT